MRDIWIGSGWKMNKTRAEAVAFAQALRGFLGLKGTPIKLFVVPPFTALAEVSRVLAGTPVLVGAQNMHWQDSGPFTGEVSPTMVKDCGAQIVELGHSERREAFGETDYTVNLKVLAALRHGLRPLVCVGETSTEKDFDVAVVTVSRQVRIALRGVPPPAASTLLVAYEPVWAIGEAGTAAEPEYAATMHAAIRETLAELYGPAIAADVPVLYGGSVNLRNAADFVQQPGVDGLFVGRAAWEADSFIALARHIESQVLTRESPVA